MRLLSAITYQDDVLVHSKDHNTQLMELQKCFDPLRAHGLQLNVTKCSFGQIEVAYLGFTLTPDGILPGKDKSAAIKSFPPPTTKCQVREFVGLCNYFRQSIPGFSLISQHLTKLTRNDCEWKGGEMPETSIKAFQSLKNLFLDPPVLAYPDPNLDYHLMVEASIGSETVPGGLGAALVQISDSGVPQAIGFASRSL